MSNEKTPSTVIGITVSAAQAEKLAIAYLGLPTQRQAAVDEVVKLKKVDRNQATFDEIFGQKLDHYFEKGNEQIEEIESKEIASVMTRVKCDWNTACERLGLAHRSL